MIPILLDPFRKVNRECGVLNLSNEERYSKLKFKAVTDF